MSGDALISVSVLSASAVRVMGDNFSVGWTWSLSGVCGCGFVVVFTEAAFDGYLDQLLIRQVAVDRVVLKPQRWTRDFWHRTASCLHDDADKG